MDTPKIKSVTPLANYRLLVTFANRIQKIYDCQQILTLDRFQLLKKPAFFNAVQVDQGGYGISWDDERDLSEYELWTNGLEIEQETNIHTSTIPQVHSLEEIADF